MVMTLAAQLRPLIRSTPSLLIGGAVEGDDLERDAVRPCREVPLGRDVKGGRRSQAAVSSTRGGNIWKGHSCALKNNHA